MSKWIKRFSVPVMASVLVLAAFAFQNTTVLAYGSADQPLAQIELSANCNNPTAEFCQELGEIGGVWLRFEIDGVDSSGDVAGAGCVHTVGGPGLDSSFPILGDVTWESVTAEAPQATYGDAFLGAIDPNGQYYLVYAPLIDEYFLFPKTEGHYSSHPAPGVAIEIQIAP